VRKLGGDLEHALAKQRHPGGAVGLLQVTPGRQRRAAIEGSSTVASSVLNTMVRASLASLRDSE
jgi:hypothetical protein